MKSIDQKKWFSFVINVIAVTPTMQHNSIQKHYWENFKISDHKYRVCILKITVFLADIGQTTKQSLSKIEPRKA